MAQHRIIPRSEWGAKPPKKTPRRIAIPSSELWLHHSVTEGFGPLAVKDLQRIAFGRGFNDISYSYVVDQLGNIYEARGHGIEGAHTESHNTVSHGICAVGNFEIDAPTDALIASIAWLVKYGAERRWWKTPLITGGHRDVLRASTACPGKQLHSQINRINYEANQPASSTAPTAPPLAAPTHFRKEKMTRREYHISGLDKDGNGWISLANVDYNRVVSILCHGSNPETDGYWPIPKFGAQQRGNNTIVEINGGIPNQSGFVIVVWVAD